MIHKLAKNEVFLRDNDKVVVGWDIVRAHMAKSLEERETRDIPSPEQSAQVFVLASKQKPIKERKARAKRLGQVFVLAAEYFLLSERNAREKRAATAAMKSKKNAASLKAKGNAVIGWDIVQAFLIQSLKERRTRDSFPPQHSAQVFDLEARRISNNEEKTEENQEVPTAKKTVKADVFLKGDGKVVIGWHTVHPHLVKSLKQRKERDSYPSEHSAKVFALAAQRILINERKAEERRKIAEADKIRQLAIGAFYNANIVRVACRGRDVVQVPSEPGHLQKGATGNPKNLQTFVCQR
jgi:hypothetical protein